MKTCRSCQVAKSLDEFYAHPTMGTQTACKDCDRARARARYAEKGEVVRQYVREYRTKNREVVNANARRYYRENATELKRKKMVRYREHPEKFIQQTRGVKLKAQYGITQAEFNVLAKRQKGVCAICKGPPVGNRNLSVDHSHKDGRLRGLLCHNCNAGLGHFKDDPTLLLVAAAYVGSERCLKQELSLSCYGASTGPSKESNSTTAAA